MVCTASMFINVKIMIVFSDLDRHYEYTGSGEVSGRRLVSHSGDILLGTVTVPLLALLSHKTGLQLIYIST